LSDVAQCLIRQLGEVARAVVIAESVLMTSTKTISSLRVKLYRDLRQLARRGNHTFRVCLEPPRSQGPYSEARGLKRISLFRPAEIIRHNQAGARKSTTGVQLLFTVNLLSASFIAVQGLSYCVGA
jgi:hypothetical protein